MSLISGIELADSPHPMTIGVPPTHWYEPDEITDVSGNASEIRCKAGSGDTLSQGTSTYRPTINASGWNGKQTLDFSTDDNLYKDGGMSGLVGGDADRTIILCVNSVVLLGIMFYNHILHYGDNFSDAYGTYGICCRVNPAGGPFDNWGNHYWSFGYNTGNSGTSGNIITMKYQNSVDYAYIDGLAASTPSHSPASNLDTDTTEFRLGSRINMATAQGTETPTSFTFGGAVVYNYALSDHKIAAIVRYYKNKYAIT